MNFSVSGFLQSLRTKSSTWLTEVKMDISHFLHSWSEVMTEMVDQLGSILNQIGVQSGVGHFPFREFCRLCLTGPFKM